MKRTLFAIAALLFPILTPPLAAAEFFRLPTANHALFEPGGEARFLAGTTGKPPSSGGFGCVRTDGHQMHEGLDIRSIQPDKKGEPADPVMATADGDVVYVNNRPSLSNYGNYLVLRHRVDGLEVYSLYAHLSAFRPGLTAGTAVKQGEVIATMGRTSNTRERIARERAHVHFELNLVINERFEAWHEKTQPGVRNDHGRWNGLNLLGFDPSLVLLAQTNSAFNLVTFLQTQPELCRVLVRKTDFPFLRRYPALIQKNPVAEKEGAAGYELVLNFNGLPVKMIPRAASEIKSAAKVHLLSVNEAEFRRCSCRKLVVRKSATWDLAENGRRLVDLLTY